MSHNELSQTPFDAGFSWCRISDVTYKIKFWRHFWRRVRAVSAHGQDKNFPASLKPQELDVVLFREVVPTIFIIL